LSKTDATAGNRLDRLGMTASLACAVHCAAIPALIGLLPIFGLSFLAKETTEWLLAGLSVGIGSLRLLPSYARIHRRVRPLLLFAFGAGMIVTIRLIADTGPRLEAPVMAAGTLLISLAHFFNLRLCRSCAACRPAAPRFLQIVYIIFHPSKSLLNRIACDGICGNSPAKHPQVERDPGNPFILHKIGRLSWISKMCGIISVGDEI
jgi:MerC mercury resistance protein